MDLQKYRPDIDGLRAVAILSVLFFHLELPYATGGFVGVDVFFVISGFLITKLIKNEVESTHRLRFRNFYLRRTRRLFPALLFTLAVTFVPAAVLFSPHDLERVGGALLSALASVSNVYFWLESGYFETEAALKPLLHTWSLGVEEQFYLVWPVFLWAIIGRGGRFLAPVVIALVGGFSLALNLAFLDDQSLTLQTLRGIDADRFGDGRSAIFFLAPFRVFEFAIGALLVWCESAIPRSRLLLEAALITGLALIVYAVVQFDEQTPFPATHGLIPCIGAGLAILAGRAPTVGKILDNRVMVGLGLISYSLYLIHWPLIVFWRYYNFRDPVSVEKLTLFALSIGCAYLMYRFVERPFRIPAGLEGARSTRRYLLASGALALLVAAPAAHDFTHRGWTWRLPDEVRQSIGQMRAKRSKYWGEWKLGAADLQHFTPKKLSVVVIGNSYAYDAANMLDLLDDFEVYYEGTTTNKCDAFTLASRKHRKRFSKRCARAKAKFERRYPRTDIIVLGDHRSTWEPRNRQWKRELRANIRSLRSYGFDGPIVVYGERPVYRKHVFRLLLRFGRLSGIENFAGAFLLKDIDTMRMRATATAQYFRNLDVNYFSPIGQLCDDAICRVLDPDQKLLYFDRDHYTYDGLEFLAPGFAHYLRAVANGEIPDGVHHAAAD